MYGRGVSDNKGPMLAVAAAVGELRRKGELEVEVVMLVEGEEETGSAGFQEAVRRNRVSFGFSLRRSFRVESNEPVPS